MPIESLGTTEKYRQISWRKALYLEGKTRLMTSDLSPKEATHMSRDIKYIGYVELDIADTMWPSGLYRVAVPWSRIQEFH